MVFSSITFLFFFLPMVLAVYFLCGQRMRNIVLLLASLFFYAWGEGVYLLVMVLSIAVNYLCGRLVGEKSSSSRLYLFFGVVFNILVLVFFKYANFLVDNLNNVLALAALPSIVLEPVHLPIGVSFFTFQAVSYIVDVYRGHAPPQRNLINLGLYISLFPQLIAGPIVRYNSIAREIVERRVKSEDFVAGIERFIFGLSKKVLLANPLAMVADRIFSLPAAELSTPVAWLGALCYSLQIYFDFSGYSDMAIGLGRIFGFHFLENFNYPYISKSIKEFWRRWHISLSSWFRDYVYIPLGGSRHGVGRTYRNLVLVFLLCGFWHGASWTFVIWGAYHGLFLVLERTSIGTVLGRVWAPLQYLMTLVIVVIGWVIFRSETMSQAIYFIGVMFGFTGELVKPFIISTILNKKLVCELVAACCLAVGGYPVLIKFSQFIKGGVTLDFLGDTLKLMVLLGLSYFTVISLAAGVYNPFIYFRF